jgi:hypothetical protein
LFKPEAKSARRMIWILSRVASASSSKHNRHYDYTWLVDFKEDDFILRIADSEEEAGQLIEAGFDYVCDFESNRLFRKRK